MLKDKTHLEELKLEWCEHLSEGECRDDEEVLDGLKPHTNLKDLMIRCYRGSKSPMWMQHCLSNLQFLDFFSCCHLTKVTSLPRTLKALYICGCDNLMEIGSLPHGLNCLEVYACPKLIQLSPFPSGLKELHVRNCPGIVTLLSSLSDDDDEEKEEEKQNKGSHQPFTLRTIVIENCPDLCGKTLIAASLQKKFGTLCVKGLTETINYIISSGSQSDSTQ